MASIDTITMNDLSSMKMTVLVKTTRQLRFRLWLAIRLIRLVGIILRCEISFSSDGKYMQDNELS